MDKDFAEIQALNHKIKGFPCFLLILCALHYSLFVILLLPENVFAENPKEKYNKIQKEIESHKERLEKAKRHEYSVFEDIEQVSRRLISIEVELKKQQRRLRLTESEIKRVETEISVNKEYLDKKKFWMKKKMLALQRYGQSGDILLLVTVTDDISETMRRWKYLEKITLYEKKMIDGYKENIRQLSEKEKHLQGLRAEMKRDEERIRLTEASLSEKKKDKEYLLASIKREKLTYEKMLKELQESSERLLDAIKKLDEKDDFTAKGFPELKGKLFWPVNGKVVINYGSQNDPTFNTPVFRNGIYIKADGESVRAVHAGKVVFADWFKGYGNLLIVNHGEGYHTLYANLSEIFFKVGDIIKVKAIIGRVGESVMLNAPSLYFEVRYKGKPLNPLQWLKRR